MKSGLVRDSHLDGGKEYLEHYIPLHIRNM